MQFYQESGFNLLVYGVGSKRTFLNIYIHEQVRMDMKKSVLVVNGYHSGTNIKTVLRDLVTYVMNFLP
jgi:hypothetical protein